MKFRSKRILAILLGTTLMVSGFAGCGNGTATQSESKSAASQASEKQTTEEQTTVAEESKEEAQKADPFGKYEEEITLHASRMEDSTTVYVPGYEDFEDAEHNVWISAYKDMLGINVTYDWISGDYETYNTKWNLAMAQGKLPDFGFVDATTYLALYDAGLCMDMTDIFEEYASDDFKAYLDADGGITRQFCTQDGRMMVLPVTGATPEGVSLLFVRKDWLDELGLGVPKTTEELIEVAKAFKDNKMGGEDTLGLICCKDTFSNNQSLRGFFEGYGAYIDTWVVDETTGKLVYSSTCDNVKEPLLKLQEMYKNGLINQDFAVVDVATTGEQVASGKVGLLYTTGWISQGIKACVENDPETEWVVAEIPTVDGSSAVVQASASPSQFIFVNKDCEHPEAVVKLMNLEIELLDNDDIEVASKYTSTPSPADASQNIATHKYTATNVRLSSPWLNLINCQEIIKAYETGEEKFELASSEKIYLKVRMYSDDKDLNGFNGWYIYGPEGTYSVIGKYKEEDRILLNQYQTLPTETMKEKSSVLKDALGAAMIKVIMGEDISTYEKAVEEWYRNGGQIMTDEANAWYGTK